MRQVPSLGSADQFYARRAAISNVNESNANWKLRNTCQPAFEKCHYGIAEVATQLSPSSSSLRQPATSKSWRISRGPLPSFARDKIAETYSRFFLFFSFILSISSPSLFRFRSTFLSFSSFLRTLPINFPLFQVYISFSRFFYLRFLWIYPFTLFYFCFSFPTSF